MMNEVLLSHRLLDYKNSEFLPVVRHKYTSRTTSENSPAYLFSPSFLAFSHHEAS